MRPIPLIIALSAFSSTCPAQDEPKPQSNYVKLLEKAPEARMAPIVDILGKRGDAADLAYLLDRSVKPQGFPTAIRAKALNTLAEAALNRKVRPEGKLDDLIPLLKPNDSKVDPATRLAATKLAGVWKLGGAVGSLANLAKSRLSEDAVRVAAFDSLASIGDKEARAAIEGLAAPGQAGPIRALAVAALVRIDVDAASDRAAGLLADASRIEEVMPVVSAFLDRQGGPEKLASALSRRKPSADGARLALRSLYASGRSDESLVAELSKAAGIDAEAKAPTKEYLDAMLAEVATKGDAARGEAVFRRAELNCMKCHAIKGAAGGVGPELTAVGLSSPPDYMIYSVLVPDQSIKEEYQTRIVNTDDGRTFQGIVVEEDDKKLVLREATGETRSIPASSVEESRKGGSLMPKGLANLMTRGEFVDLVKFLAELGKPGPYAINGVPTIQRWRVLKATPEGLARFVPDAEAFKAQVLDTDPGRWEPAYGWAAGQIPLDDLTRITGGRICYAQGEFDVSAAGPIGFKFNATSGLSAWLDDKPLVLDDHMTAQVAEGRHKLTLRVDTDARDGLPISAEIARPAGSPVQFSVVGGR